MAACASAPEIYELPDPHYVEQQMTFEAAGPQIEQGRPIPPLDALNHYLLSLPTKVLLWNWRVLDHQLADGDRAILEHYLKLNRLTAVKVRHNAYAPIDELRRLIQNREVGAPYRYTLGLVTWLQYTLLPDRVLAGVPFIGGGDHFNPFSNTIHLYSSDLGVALHEAGHAKDYLQHESKGTSFIMPRLLPGIDLLQEANASADAIRYLYCVGNSAAELRAYRTLIPAYSTYIAGYFEGGLVVSLPLVLAGHVSGRLQARSRERALAREAEFPEEISRDDFLPDFCRAMRNAPDEPPELGAGAVSGADAAVERSDRRETALQRATDSESPASAAVPALQP